MIRPLCASRKLPGGLNVGTAGEIEQDVETCIAGCPNHFFGGSCGVNQRYRVFHSRSRLRPYSTDGLACVDFVLGARSSIGYSLDGAGELHGGQPYARADGM